MHDKVCIKRRVLLAVNAEEFLFTEVRVLCPFPITSVYNALVVPLLVGVQIGLALIAVVGESRQYIPSGHTVVLTSAFQFCRVLLDHT